MPLRKKLSAKNLKRPAHSDSHIPLGRTVTSEYPPQLPSLPYTLPPPIPMNHLLPPRSKQAHRRSRSFSTYTPSQTNDQPWRSHETWRAFQVGSNTEGEVEGLGVPSMMRDRGWRGRGGGGFFGNDGERVNIEKLGGKTVLRDQVINKVQEVEPNSKMQEDQPERVGVDEGKCQGKSMDRWAPGTATMLYRMKSQTNFRSTALPRDIPPFPIELQHIHHDLSRSIIHSSSTSSNEDLPPLLPSSQSQTSSPPSSLNSHHSPAQILYTPQSRYPDISQTSLIVDLPPLLPGGVSRQSSFASTGDGVGDRPVPWGRKTPSERERRSTSPITVLGGGEDKSDIVAERMVMPDVPARPARRVEAKRKEKRDVGVGMWMAGMGATMGGVGRRSGVVVEQKGKSVHGGKGGWI